MVCSHHADEHRRVSWRIRLYGLRRVSIAEEREEREDGWEIAEGSSLIRGCYLL
jgi:hypothetical protein